MATVYDNLVGQEHITAILKGAVEASGVTMRERALDWRGLAEGLSNLPRLRIYASAETHSSVDKAVRLSGIGQDNLVKIPTDTQNSMQPGALAEAIAGRLLDDLQERGDSVVDLVKHMTASGHSRVPVYRGTLDDVLGMVHIKDLMGYVARAAAVVSEEGKKRLGDRVPGAAPTRRIRRTGATA